MSSQFFCRIYFLAWKGLIYIQDNCHIMFSFVCCFRWIYHHYCAMLMAVVSLTWDFKGQHPHCEEKQVSNWSTLEYIYVLNLNLVIGYNQHGIRHFLLWAMMQGVVMLLQNRYQRQRLYTRIALGKVPLLTLTFFSRVLKTCYWIMETDHSW